MTILVILLFVTMAQATGGSEIHRFIADLGSNDGVIVIRSVDQLSQIGAPVIPDLVTLLEQQDSQSAWQRQQALRVLGNIGGPEAVAQIGRSLRDSNRDVRQQAARMAARLGTDAVPLVDQLASHLLVESDAQVKSAIVEALGTMGVEAQSAVPALIIAFSEGEPTVILATVNAMQRIRPGTVAFGDRVAVLSRILADQAHEPAVRSAAASGLAATIPSALDLLISLGQVTSPAIEQALMLLEGSLTDHSQEVRDAAAKTLERLESAVARIEGNPYYIGEMTPFWRHRPVLGRWLIGRLGLMPVPDYLVHTSFPYKQRDSAEEVLFTDHLSVVRLLGGWGPRQGVGGEYGRYASPDQADLAYRDRDGVIQYRLELLGPRLDPYIGEGYTEFTIVLDNTPWAFPGRPISGSFGQSAPPADFQEWEDFVRAVVTEMVRLYGYDMVSTWRFRLGTELDWNERFSGTLDQHMRFYDHAAAAVRSVVPDAKFGPSNQMRVSADRPMDVDHLHIAEHLAEGRNYATGGEPSPFDFSAISLYKGGGAFPASPETKVLEATRFWDSLARIHPQLSDISREVHEFGILFNEFGVATSEPGALGAAWTFHTIIGLRERGLTRLWKWDVEEKTTIRPLLMSNGWLYSIMDYTVGGKTYVLPVEVASQGVGTVYKSVAVILEDRTMVITSAYNANRTVTAEEEITLRIPAELGGVFGDIRVETVYLDRSNSVHARIREDFAREGFLTESFAVHEGTLGAIVAMGGQPGRSYVNRNLDHYEAIVQETLTLKPFTGSFTQDEQGQTLAFTMRPPMVKVIVLDAPE